MNSTRNLLADDIQIWLNNSISIVSTIINFIGFYVIIVQKSRESRHFALVQLFYQFVLYFCQVYAGSILNIVFLFPLPGAYCIGLLRNLSGFSALLAFGLFDVLFSLQGALIAVLMFMKTMTLARPGSPFRMSELTQRIFISVVIGGSALSQIGVLLASYSNPTQVAAFLQKTYPNMTFLLRYNFLWMLTTNRHFVGVITSIFICIGLVFMVCMMSFIILIFELDLQVNTMSKSSNKYHRKLANEFMSHTFITLPFFILVPFLILIKFFLDENTDVAVLTTGSFAFFISAPIPSMLAFLYKNPAYRTFIIKEFHIPTKQKTAVKATNSRQTQSRVQAE